MKKIIITLIIFQCFNLFIFAQRVGNFKSNEKKETVVKKIDYISKEKKSINKAVLLSLIVPGLGEYYVSKEDKRFAFFSAAELGLWLGEYYAYKMEEYRDEDSKRYARLYAKCTYNGDDNFYKLLSAHESIYKYNEKIIREAEDSYQYGSDAYYNYINSNILSSEKFWDWTDDLSKWRDYKNFRYDKKTWQRKKMYFISAILINHVLSAVDAGRFAYKSNKILENLGNIDFNIEYSYENNYINPVFVISKRF